MREYTLVAGVAVLGSVLLEVGVARTGMFRDRRYWLALGVVIGFQLLVNGLLTCPPIVLYDRARILGPRVACAPIEDLAFGFALVTATLSLWRRVSGHHAPGAATGQAPPPSTTGPEPPGGSS